MSCGSHFSRVREASTCQRFLPATDPQSTCATAGPHSHRLFTRMVRVPIPSVKQGYAIERVLAGADDEDDFKCCLPQWKRIGENNTH